MTKPQDSAPANGGAVCMLTAKETYTRNGHKRAKLHDDVRQGLQVQPIRRGRKFSRWPSNEVDAILHARLAGDDDAAIRALVQRLHEQRKARQRA